VIGRNALGRFSTPVTLVAMLMLVVLFMSGLRSNETQDQPPLAAASIPRFIILNSSPQPFHTPASGSLHRRVRRLANIHRRAVL
jgi:di/tricarboxylate transporter